MNAARRLAASLTLSACCFSCDRNQKPPPPPQPKLVGTGTCLIFQTGGDNPRDILEVLGTYFASHPDQRFVAGQATDRNPDRSAVDYVIVVGPCDNSPAKPTTVPAIDSQGEIHYP